MTKINPHFYNYEYMNWGVGDSPNVELYKYYTNLLDNSKSILEIGCGTGLLTQALVKLGYLVKAIDISHECKKILFKNCGISNYSESLIFENIDILYLKTIEKYSLILASDDFLRHILTEKNLQLFFSKIKDLLLENGTFITDLRIENSNIYKEQPLNILKLKRRTKNIKYIKSTLIRKSKDKNDNLKMVFKYEEFDENMILLNCFNKTLCHNSFTIKRIKEISEKCGLSIQVQKKKKIGHCFLIFKNTI